ncbi:carbohydrate porin [Ferruginibacter albus]|uniref:carbohydrate porin n=1 Tax=Ferruginibacter albus TaxID=2875540 RepID=UPI001CC38C23|nr:carbohydrate porin [Ferruginibacter albus]UAY51788.1 carbohydrate porin [Ferruginibacter albus]
MLVLCRVHAQIGDSVKEERFSIHAQTTIINQYKPPFSAAYTGKNSLLTGEESKTSITSTFFAGMRLWKGASIFINPEIAGGSGLSEALGVADATNGETFRVGDPAPKIYLARLFFKQIFSLSNKQIFQQDDLNQLATTIPDKYLAVTIGKIGMADYFDNNKYSHDPRTQFMSWSLMSNGGWDYPANTRGYTPSVVLEYISPKNEVRYAISLVPVVANGNEMNWSIGKASSQTIEYTHRYKLYSKEGAIRLLGFYTSANMGNYNQSIALDPINPSIEDSRKYGNTKYGFGINAEQEITKDLGCFFRASWNDGNNETWMFTEIDHSISAGLSTTGEKWKRENDNAGIGYVASGISKPHQDYLKAGGNGFMLGDGNLTYGWEHLVEFYYSAELVKNQIYLTGAYQLLINPGYNADRQGPVNILSIRLHARI